ncbi:DNA cytosine methyltransferase [Nocardia transvalensis]|uniref:DNA cytosine methyltransferase n=1 Tax=Nocardia transvalensis TaxID=37333 RepID=UPI001893AC9A|nr:DNA cytosine methyltransferase [Nocardia transvalensis]MBF6329227.1 DNA cytosine methyltransferase [Nocardia transvalensis]
MPSDQPPTSSQIHMVDLFAGPGGLDVAAHWLGVSVDGIEWDKDACATRDAAGLSTKQGDVLDFSPTDFPHATVLAGGPPCQTYTVAGSGTGRDALNRVLAMVDRMTSGRTVIKNLGTLHRRNLKELYERTGDERTGLVLEPLRWALEAYREGSPYEAIVLEQVPAVLPVWTAIGMALNKIGYFVDCGILHTEQYGVPQTRRRAILIARLDRQPFLPEPTHHLYRKGMRQKDYDSSLLPWVSMGDALARHNFAVISNYGTGGDPKARGRRAWEEPAATVTGKISRNRLISTIDGSYLGRFSSSEAGQLQTFPFDYPWSERNTAQQIGNAIPPRLAVHVLAATLNWRLNQETLDQVVKASWQKTKHGMECLFSSLQ